MLRTTLALIVACVVAAACGHSSTDANRGFSHGHAKSAAPAAAKPLVHSEPMRIPTKPATDRGSLAVEKAGWKLKEETVRALCGRNYDKPHLGESYFSAHACLYVEHAYSDVSVSGQHTVLRDRSCSAYSYCEYRLFNRTMIGWPSF